ncbi:HAD-IIIA family hydrolase [Bacillus sp. DJP31]|uniref:HAD-IIIA family hydrolase n=1 Tax=Bacillus sp. DJP31 TaxID=3409789 RepID=UPI003BB7BA39
MNLKQFEHTIQQLLEGFSLMEETLSENQAFLNRIFYCPHQPDDKCECHKPNIGLLLKAQKEHNLDLSKCYVVGDTGSSDMMAASKVGAKMVLVRTGWGESSLAKFRHTWSEVEPNYIAKDLVEAITWIVNDIEYNNRT